MPIGDGAKEGLGCDRRGFPDPGRERHGAAAILFGRSPDHLTCDYWKTITVSDAAQRRGDQKLKVQLPPGEPEHPERIDGDRRDHHVSNADIVGQTSSN